MKDQSTLAIARGLWAATAEGDADAVARCLAEDIVWDVPGRNPISGRYQGPAQVLDYLAQIGEAADELVSTLKRVYVEGAGAVVLYHVRASRGVKRLDMNYLLQIETEKGRITLARTFPQDQDANDEFWNFAAG